MEARRIREPAKVLQFPWRSVQAAARESRLLLSVRPVCLPRIAPANCWYHDAAIAEDQARPH
jgi:hypothetical protein